LLPKGGTVIHIANRINYLQDTAVANGKIAAVQKDSPPSSARKVVDVTGLYVAPGFIDIHMHVGHGGASLDWFEPAAGSPTPPLGLIADTALSSGVTTMVDAGSSGARTSLRQQLEVIAASHVLDLAFLTIV